MAGPVLLLLVGLLLIIVRLLHLASKASPPTLYYRNNTFNSALLQHCPLLFEPYIPPLLWGKSGHLQTVIYSKRGWISSPLPSGKRHSLLLSDGATLTFDVYEPVKKHWSGDDYTLLICPGIANSSESVYVCGFVLFAQEKGYRVCVLNHLGAIHNIPLTSPRIFTYGSTEEYGKMVDTVHSLYPTSSLIGVGFSMGANILLKYLGEDAANQDKLLCAVSCCQGYSITQVESHLLSWEHARRAYMWAMTLNLQRLLRRHAAALFSSSHSDELKRTIFRTTSLQELDKLYTSKMAGYDSLKDFYEDSSCSRVINNIKMPVLVVNSLDDPLVPNDLHKIPRDFALTQSKAIFATTSHGGHLGYFQGGLLVPESVTWLDKLIIQYTDAVIKTEIWSKKT